MGLRARTIAMRTKEEDSAERNCVARCDNPAVHHAMLPETAISDANRLFYFLISGFRLDLKPAV